MTISVTILTLGSICSTIPTWPHQNDSTMLENGDCSYSATQSAFFGNGYGQLNTAA